MRTLLLTLTALLFMANSCDKNQKRFLKHVENTTEIQCFSIEEYPTEPSQHAIDETYILEYKVINQIELTDAQQTEIKTYFLNTDNYTSKVARTCPFFGAFALVFLDGSDSLEMVLSKENCPKGLVKGKKEVFNLDLVELSLYSNLIIN